jgi:hypothetical protein
MPLPDAVAVLVTYPCRNCAGRDSASGVARAVHLRRVGRWVQHAAAGVHHNDPVRALYEKAGLTQTRTEGGYLHYSLSPTAAAVHALT